MYDEMIDPFGTPEFFCDLMDGHEERCGVMRWAGYRLQRQDGKLYKIATVRLMMPVSSLSSAISRALRVAHGAEMITPDSHLHMS